MDHGLRSNPTVMSFLQRKPVVLMGQCLLTSRKLHFGLAILGTYCRELSGNDL